MWIKNCFVLIFFSLPYSTKAATIEEDQGVLVLTDENFDDALRLHNQVLVEFYAPWCHVCNALTPEFAKAAQTLRYDNPDVKIAKVDATENLKLNERFRIMNGYPKLKMFKNGSPVEYKGGRTAKSIVSWFYKHSGPALIQVNSGNDIRKLQQNNDVVIVGFFKNSGSYGASSFSYVAPLVSEIFAITSDPSVYRENSMNETVDGVLLLKNFEEQRDVYNGTFDYNDLHTWINANRYPTVIDFTTETSNGMLLASDVKPRNLLFIGRSDYNYDKIYVAYRDAAQEFRGRVLFEVVDTDRNSNQFVMDEFGARKNEQPKIRVFVDGQGATQYTSTFSDFSKENIIQFTKDTLSRIGM